LWQTESKTIRGKISISFTTQATEAKKIVSKYFDCINEQDCCLLSGSLNSFECFAKKSFGSVAATFGGPCKERKKCQSIRN